MFRVGPSVRRGASAALAVLLFAGPVFAADDLLSPRFDLTIWTIIIFVLLFLVLRKFAWGPILKGLQQREHNIESAIEEARRARDEMALHKADFERKLAEAHQEIPMLIAEARRDADLLREDMKAKATAEINADRDRLRRDIETARDQALSELWTQTANLATLISAKAIKRSVNADDHKRLVDEALREMKEAGTKIVSETASLRR